MGSSGFSTVLKANLYSLGLEKSSQAVVVMRKERIKWPAVGE